MPVEDFVQMKMHKKFIKTIHFTDSKKAQKLSPVFMKTGPRGMMIFPAAQKTRGMRTYIKTFKIMPRSSNAHAYVNAGFLFDVDSSLKIISKPSIVYGGINSIFTHANQLEIFLTNKNMDDHDVFLEAVGILESELVPDEDPALSSSAYRKQLAVGLLYKVKLNKFENLSI